MPTLEERMAKVEGILEEVRMRLNHVEARLDHVIANKADKWEIRIWFLILIVLITVYQFLD